MADLPPTLPPLPDDQPGLDYAALRSRALEALARMAPLWTDFNAHDPGVTIVEQVCFALTDLAFAAAPGVRDLLAEDDGSIDLTARGLFRPARVLPSRPVTLTDVRRLLLDRLPKVEQAWVSVAQGGPRGLYDLVLYAPTVSETAQGERQHLRAAARRLLARYRNLAEDAASIVIAEPLEVAISADIHLERSGAAAEQVAADILFRIGTILAPEVQRGEPKATQIDGGFDGPRLRGGWVTDDQLGAKPGSLNTARLLHTAITAPGVVDATSFQISIDGAAAPNEIAIDRCQVLAWDIGRRDASLPLRFFREGKLLDLDAARVRLDLARRRAAHRARGRGFIPTQMSEAGRRRPAPSPYISVQESFPALYGLGQAEPPVDAPRRAEVQQLQGYLAVFDLELSSTFELLQTLPQLVSSSSPPKASPPRERLRATPGADVLISAQGKVDSDRLRDAHLALLDVLLALQGREPPIGRVDAPWQAILPSPESARRKVLLRAGARSGAASAGGDYLAPTRRRRLSELERVISDQFGFRTADTLPFNKVLERHEIELASDRELRPVIDQAVSDLVEARFHRYDWEERLKDEGRPFVLRRRRLLSPDLLATMPQEVMVRFGRIGRGRRAALAGWSGRVAQWRIVGGISVEDVLEEARGLHALLRDLCGEVRRCYLVDHILLRHGGKDLPVPAGATVTMIICDPRWSDDADYRRQVWAALVDNVPAHVVPRMVFLTAAELVGFERLRDAWLKSLRTDGADLRATCGALALFLAKHTVPNAHG